ncbi:MAG: GreA/GreB family elongation factor [Pseudomonadota bacterium]
MKIDRYLTQHDASTLSKLAEQLLRVRDVKVNPAENLIDLISTSILLPENIQKKGYVSLNSTVRYRNVHSNDEHSIVIVCPQNVDSTLAHISVLAPLAMALIGQKEGRVVEVELPFNKVQFIEILEVRDLSCDVDDLVRSGEG